MRATRERVAPTRPLRSRLIRTLSRSISERRRPVFRSKSTSIGPLDWMAFCSLSSVSFGLEVVESALVQLVYCIFVSAV
jgi:hypothetical protein